MDIATIVGLIVGWGGLLMALLWEAHFDVGALAAYANGPGLMIIVAGTAGATVIRVTGSTATASAVAANRARIMKFSKVSEGGRVVL